MADEPNVDGLRAQAEKILRGNDVGEFTKPSPRQYPHQWNWDAALIALGLSHFDLPRALTEIRALLRGQWRDGMMPHILYHTGPSDYFPDPDFWQITNSPNAPAMATSGLTQPPVLATVVRTIHARTPIPNFVRQAYPALLRWHRWLHTARDADGTALACIIHPWESGTDDSPRWLRAMADITPRELPPYRRRDTVHVPNGERPSDADYECFVHLIDVFRKNRYEPSRLLARSPFLVQDILFNSILYRADEDLGALARELGEPTDEIDGWMDRVRANFNARFWDDARGLYLDYDMRAGAPIEVNTAVAFMPLFAGLASEQQAARLVAEHFDNPLEYAPNADSNYRMPSAAKNERAYSPRRYWCGPVWINLNWMIAEGLRRYGYGMHADLLVRDALALMQMSGLREYYDPRDGSGCGATDFSWSAALAIEMLTT
jgi:Trehalase